MSRLIALFVFLLAANATAATTAFVNVNVVPMTSDAVLPAQTVIVRGSKIEMIAAVDAVPVPEDAQIIDGTDRFLMPGLTEMHAHIPATGTEALDRVLGLFAANGVTTVRGMLGRPSHLQLRDELNAGTVFGPRLITSGPSLNGNSVNGPADGRAKVIQQFEAGYDFVKLHPGLSRSEFDAIAGAAQELDFTFAGHVSPAYGLQHALDAGMATIDHLDGYLAALVPADRDFSGGYGGFFDVLLADDVVADGINKIAAATAAAGTWNVPTQSLFEHRVSRVSPAELRNRPEMRYMPVETVQRWVQTKERQLAERGFDPDIADRAIAIRRQLILALHNEGAGLLLGSDAPQVFNVPGFSLHQELEFLVAAGLTPYEALQTGTTNVARFFDKGFGTIVEGGEADLVLVDDNPLADISNTQRIHGVMMRGSWLSPADLEQILSALRSESD